MFHFATTPQSRKPKAASFAALLLLASLTACSGMSLNPFKSDRPQQRLAGGRHMPAYNRLYKTPEPTTETPMPAPAPSAMPQPPVFAPPAPGSMPAADEEALYREAAGDEANGDGEMSAVQEQPFPATPSSPQEIRKLFPGNPFYRRSEEVKAPTLPPPPPPAEAPSAHPLPPPPPAPGGEDAARMPQPLSRVEITGGPQDIVSDAPRAPEVKEEMAQDQGKTWFERLFESDDGDEEASAAAAEAGAGAHEAQDGYPSLSSVPPRPARFEALKGQQQEKIEDLQQSHLQAQHDKRQLDQEEPSTRPAPHPVWPDLDPNAPQARGLQPLLGSSAAPAAR